MLVAGTIGSMQFGINQTNIDEKIHQVRFMGQIFESAAHVHACIGQHADDSEFVFSILDNFPCHLLQNLKPTWPGVRSNARVIMWLLSHSREDIERLSKGFASTLSRPYFKRVWMLQEVFRKQSRTSLYCGKDRQSLNVHFFVNHALRWMPLNPDGGSYLLEKLKAFANMAANHKFSAVDYRYCYYDFPSSAASFLIDVSFPGQRSSNRASGYTTEDGKDGLEEVIGMLNGFQCQDPRDRIYGTLSLVDWASPIPISPNYRKSRFDVALEVLSCGWDRRQFTNIACILELATAFSLDIGDQETVSSICAHYQRAIKPTKLPDSTRNAAASKQTLLALWREVGRTNTVSDQDLRRHQSGSMQATNPNALDQDRPTVSVRGHKTTNSALSNEVWIGFSADIHIGLVVRPDDYGELTISELSMAPRAQENQTYAGADILSPRTGVFDVVFDPADVLIFASILGSCRSSEKVPHLLELLWEIFRHSEPPSEIAGAKMQRQNALQRSSETAKLFEWSKAHPLTEQESLGRPRLLRKWVRPGTLTLRRLRYHLNTLGQNKSISK